MNSGSVASSSLSPAGWRTITLGKLCADGGGHIQTGPFGSQLHAEDYVDDVRATPVVMPQDIIGGRIVTENIARIGDADVSRLEKYVLQEGDIVQSRRGDVTRRALVREEHVGWLCGTGCLRVRLGDSAVPRFVAYALSHPTAQAWIERHAVGATMPNLNTTILGAIPIALPTESEQTSIAGVLGALDDKIDSNRRLAALLEETATTLFRGRLMDFVGVTDLVDSEVGPIPPGWEVQPLDELTVNLRNRATATDRPYIGLDDMPRGSTVLDSWKEEDAPAGSSWVFSRGDILFGKLRPYFRKVGIAPVDGRCSTEILVLQAKRSDLFGLVLGHISSAEFIAHCNAVSSGTRMPRAEWNVAGAYKVPVPPASISAEFSETARAIYDQIVALTHESRTLVELRDTLLPKLVSGELRVAEAGEVVEAA